MNKKQILETVEKELETIVGPLNYEVVDVEFVKEGPNHYLRLYIDKEGGVTIEDCQKTSRAIEAVLDEKEVIDIPYILEVSSPGLDRILKKDKEFERFKGRVVDVNLYKAINGEKKLQAELVSKVDDELTLLDEDENTLTIDMKDVARVRLAILF